MFLTLNRSCRVTLLLTSLFRTEKADIGRRLCAVHVGGAITIYLGALPTDKISSSGSVLGGFTKINGLFSFDGEIPCLSISPDCATLFDFAPDDLLVLLGASFITCIDGSQRVSP